MTVNNSIIFYINNAMPKCIYDILYIIWSLNSYIFSKLSDSLEASKIAFQ